MRTYHGWALLALSMTGCAPILPKDKVQRALVRDLARAVETREQLGWMVDELDIQEILPDALYSVCRVESNQRTAALFWLEETIQKQGGPIKEAYARNNNSLSGLEDLLVLHRTRLVLRTAHQWAEEGKCPFWIETDAKFSGVQGFYKRFVLGAESGGRFYGQMEGDKPGFGGGGAARVLVGYGFTDRWTLMAGVEFGGAGRFTDLRIGERAQVPAVLLIANVPIIARFHRISDHIDVELGPVAYFNQLRGLGQLGGRIGFGTGFMRLKMRGFFPTVTFAATYDYIPPQGGAPAVHQLGGGLRAGLNLAL